MNLKKIDKTILRAISVLSNKGEDATVVAIREAVLEQGERDTKNNLTDRFKTVAHFSAVERLIDQCAYLTNAFFGSSLQTIYDSIDRLENENLISAVGWVDRKNNAVQLKYGRAKSYALTVLGRRALEQDPTVKHSI